jgi:hypothetical protein
MTVVILKRKQKSTANYSSVILFIPINEREREREREAQTELQYAMAMGSVMAYTPGSQYGSLCPLAASPALSLPSCFVSRRQLFQPRLFVKRLASWQHRPSTIQASDSLYMGIIVCQRY